MLTMLTRRSVLIASVATPLVGRSASVLAAEKPLVVSLGFIG